jgi:hypothetical protein
MHKTGSTAIQRAFGGYDDGRVLYAPLSMQNHSLPLVCAFAADPRSILRRGSNLTRRDMRRLGQATRDRLERLCADRRDATVVISGEAVTLLSEEDKRAMVDWLARRSGRLRIVGYLRAPAPYVASAFAEVLKSGPRPSPPALLPRYRFRFEPFLRAGGAVETELRSYASAAGRDGGVVRDFAGIVGADPGRLRTDTVGVNASPPVGALRILQAMDGAAPRRRRAGDARRRLGTLLSEAFAETGRMPQELFACREAVADLAWLREEAGVDLGSVDPEAERIGVEAAMRRVGAFLGDIPPDHGPRLRALCATEGVAVTGAASPGAMACALYDAIADGMRRRPNRTPKDLARRALSDVRRVARRPHF